MIRLSVIIPTINDPALVKTVQDVINRSRNFPEILVMADRVDVEIDQLGVRVIRN